MDAIGKGEGNNLVRPKIYLETTMFNYYFDKERGEAHRYTVQLFEMIKDGRFEAYSSYHVTRELERAEESKRHKMLELIDKYGVTLLEDNDEVDRIGNLYVENKVVPRRYNTDAMHMAIATVYGSDIIVSMNFEHIVNLKRSR